MYVVCHAVTEYVFWVDSFEFVGQWNGYWAQIWHQFKFCRENKNNGCVHKCATETKKEEINRRKKKKWICVCASAPESHLIWPVYYLHSMKPYGVDWDQSTELTASTRCKWDLSLSPSFPLWVSPSLDLSFSHTHTHARMQVVAPAHVTTGR